MGQEYKTADEYMRMAARCKKLFALKMLDYGASWRILRLPSITDQVLIKARRIRALQEKGAQQVSDSVEEDFMGMVNYCAMALILIRSQPAQEKETQATFEQIEPLYDRAIDEAYQLLRRKNHDYGEAWRNMRVGSIVDIMLMKLLRLKQLEDNNGKTRVSEGVDANYLDILNYAIFALILTQQD